MVCLCLYQISIATQVFVLPVQQGNIFYLGISQFTQSAWLAAIVSIGFILPKSAILLLYRRNDGKYSSIMKYGAAILAAACSVACAQFEPIVEAGVYSALLDAVIATGIDATLVSDAPVNKSL